MSEWSNPAEQRTLRALFQQYDKCANGYREHIERHNPTDRPRRPQIRPQTAPPRPAQPAAKQPAAHLGRLAQLDERAQQMEALLCGPPATPAEHAPSVDLAGAAPETIAVGKIQELGHTLPGAVNEEPPPGWVAVGRCLCGQPTACVAPDAQVIMPPQHPYRLPTLACRWANY